MIFPIGFFAFLTFGAVSKEPLQLFSTPDWADLLALGSFFPCSSQPGAQRKTFALSKLLKQTTGLRIEKNLNSILGRCRCHTYEYTSYVLEDEPHPQLHLTG